MNRSILIVICDFLLVSLLAFSTVDVNKITDLGGEPQLRMEAATNPVESGKDLAAVMRLALDEERKSRDQLLGELSRTREESGRQQTLLGERDQQVKTYQKELDAREQANLRLQLERESLQQRVSSSQTNIQTLSQQLQAAAAQVQGSKERAAALEAEVKKQADQAAVIQQQLAVVNRSNQLFLEEKQRLLGQLQVAEVEKRTAAEQAAQAAALQQQVALLTRSNQLVLEEKQRLAGQLQVAEVEKRNAAEQAARAQEQVKVEREEKARLAEGVKVLASRSDKLAEEIRENRPLAPNTIFSEFAANRVAASFQAFKSGALGLDSNRRKESQTILVADGTNVFALFHVEDTPLTLWTPGTDWEKLSGTIGRGGASYPVVSLSFHQRDPRLMFLPVSAEQARALGAKVYRTASDPFKFQDAVLVGAREGYYGECRFEIDLTAPDYLKLDNNFLKGLFGKFNPSRGDLVLSRTGELLGIMVNSTYCLKLKTFDPAATFRFGPDVAGQRTGQVLSLLHAQVMGLPTKLH